MSVTCECNIEEINDDIEEMNDNIEEINDDIEEIKDEVTRGWSGPWPVG